MKRFNPIRVIIVLSVLLPFFMLVAVSIGAVNLPFVDVIHSLFSFNADQQSVDIVLSIRMPRVLLAAMVGGLLAISGAAMQGLFRNPLADPSLIGVTAGASLGASVVIVFMGEIIEWGGLTRWLGLPLMSAGAFCGGMLAVWLVYRLAKGAHGTSVTTMLLAGIGITAFAASLSNLLEFYADNEMLRRISLWRMGGLEGANTASLVLMAVISTIVFLVLPRYSQALNALLLGESEARHLGINIDHLKKVLIVLVAAGVGVSVALAGAIAFVGLVVPHMLRMLIGPNHRYLLPASALGGAILLVAADGFARTVFAPTELPVGIVTAFIGVPFFISLLKHRYMVGFNR